MKRDSLHHQRQQREHFYNNLHSSTYSIFESIENLMSRSFVQVFKSKLMYKIKVPNCATVAHEKHYWVRPCVMLRWQALQSEHLIWVYSLFWFKSHIRISILLWTVGSCSVCHCPPVTLLNGVLVHRWRSDCYWCVISAGFLWLTKNAPQADRLSLNNHKPQIAAKSFNKW